MEQNKQEIIEKEICGMDFEYQITEVGKSYCTYTPTNKEEKIKLLNAVNMTTEALMNHIGDEIIIAGMYGETVFVTDRNNPDLKVQVPRIVLLTPDLTGYGCASLGILNSMRKIISTFGNPNTANMIKVKIKLVTNKNNRNVLSLEVVDVIEG